MNRSSDNSLDHQRVILMSKQVFVRLICLLTALSFGLVACEKSEESSNETQKSVEESADEEHEAAEEPSDAQPTVNVDERRRVLVTEARRQAEKEVTSDNAEEVAAALEEEISGDLEEMN